MRPALGRGEDFLATSTQSFLCSALTLFYLEHFYSLNRGLWLPCFPNTWSSSPIR
jgi:hypothetical protein